MRDVVSELKTQRDKVVRDEILTDLQESGSKEPLNKSPNLPDLS